MVHDAEALPVPQAEIGRAHRHVVLQLQARLVGVDAGAVAAGLVECVAEHGERTGACFRRARELVGVDGGKRALAGEIAVVLGTAHGLGRLDPQIVVVGGNREGAPVGGQRLVEAAGGRLDAAERGKAFRTLALLAGGQREIVAEGAGIVGHGFADEGERRRRAEVGGIVRLDDLAGDGALEMVELVEIALQEAPLHLGIIGEGAAGQVVDAVRLALVQRHVLHGAQVEAEIVAVLGGDDGARLCRMGGQGRSGGRENKKCRETEDCAHRHQVLLPLPVPLAPLSRPDPRLSIERPGIWEGGRRMAHGTRGKTFEAGGSIARKCEILRSRPR